MFRAPNLPGDPDEGEHGGTALGARASLRPYSASDAVAVIAALQDPVLTRWLAALPVPPDRQSGEKYLQFLGDRDVWARVLCVDGDLAGIISLGTELSFWIRPAFHGQGLGLWAVREFLHRLPDGTGTVTACCMAQNQAAAALLRKLGFDLVGPPFRRFSFAHGHAVAFLRFQRRCHPVDRVSGQ